MARTDTLTREALNRKLSESGLTKREFAELLGLSYATVNNWGSPGKGIPFWVASWLDNYRKAATLERIRAMMAREAALVPDVPP